MVITNSFRNAITTGDVKGIRIMMKDSLLVDPTFAEFDEMSELVRGVPGLFDPHDGRELHSDKSVWNDDYMDKLMVQVVGNFSRERISHLKEVVRYLRPVAIAHPKPVQSGVSHDTVPKTTGGQPRKSYREQKQYDQRNGSYRGAKIGAGAAAGAIAGGLVAHIAVSTAIGAIAAGVAAGAFIGGAAVAVATNGRH